MLRNNFTRTIFTVKEKKDQLNKYKFFSALVIEAMGYEQLFQILNHINKRQVWKTRISGTCRAE